MKMTNTNTCINLICQASYRDFWNMGKYDDRMDACFASEIRTLTSRLPSSDMAMFDV